MKVVFGDLKQDIDKDRLRDRLESCETLVRDHLPRVWERLSGEYQKSFSSAYFLRTKNFEEREREVRFSAEWDEIYPYSFRGKELWGARTNYAGVRLKLNGSHWMITVEGDWSIATRISSVTFDKRGRIRNLEIPSGALRMVLEDDSRAEKHMWWREIEEGVDGSLRGTLPKKTGTRSRFDKSGEPYFAKFESIQHGCVISISCRQSSISSNALTADYIIKYFEQRFLPHLRLR